LKGWVYVISNLAMPGLLKIGFSMKDPEGRAKELDSAGMPHPYVVEYAILVENPELAERESHMLLQKYLERKEWFRCEIELASAAVFKSAGGGMQTHGTPKDLSGENLAVSSQFLDRLRTKKEVKKLEYSMIQHVCSVCRKKYETYAAQLNQNARCSDCVLVSWRAEHQKIKKQH